MKRIFASSVFALLCISTAFAADQEFDQQIIMNVPPTEDLHVVTKGYADGIVDEVNEIVDAAEFPITEVVAPLYWKDPITGGASQSRYLSNITISPGSANGTILYSVDGGATVAVAVAGLGSAAYMDASAFAPASGTSGAGAEIERLKMEVAYLRGRVEALAGSVGYGGEMELAQNNFGGESK